MSARYSYGSLTFWTKNHVSLVKICSDFGDVGIAMSSQPKQILIQPSHNFADMETAV